MLPEGVTNSKISLIDNLIYLFGDAEENEEVNDEKWLKAENV